MLGNRIDEAFKHLLFRQSNKSAPRCCIMKLIRALADPSDKNEDGPQGPSSGITVILGFQNPQRVRIQHRQKEHGIPLPFSPRLPWRPRCRSGW